MRSKKRDYQNLMIFMGSIDLIRDSYDRLYANILYYE